MDSYKITPKVDETQEFIEIACDFANPLDLVREAISNAYDADATKIWILFNVIEEYGEKILKITLKDNGTGMDAKGLQSFFDLGNSLRRGDPQTIGEKGHGTKVYLNSQKIEVITTKDDWKFHAVMSEPFRKLHDRKIPEVDVKKEKIEGSESGTEINIYGYNNNRRDKFTHEILKDYIIWFTKQGAIEDQFEPINKVSLYLKGLGKYAEELVERGHYFPPDSKIINQLFEDHLTKAPDHYCKKIIKEG